jgi:flavin-binding protein dodecin
MAKNMSKTYKIIELVGISSKSYEDAIQNAVKEASQTLKGLSWFEVIQMRGGINKDKIAEYQVILKVGFRIIV